MGHTIGLGGQGKKESIQDAVVSTLTKGPHGCSGGLEVGVECHVQRICACVHEQIDISISSPFYGMNLFISNEFPYSL